MRTLPRTVCWVDPGQHIGIAILEQDTFQSFQLEGIRQFGGWLETALGFGGVALGWESYLVTGARSAESTVALRVIGAAEYLALKYGAEILPEVPSSARTTVSYRVLCALDWYTPNQEHANQAARHLAAWLAREHLLTPDQREAFTSALGEGTPE